MKALKFKFESGLPHQKEAIDSVVGIFKDFSQDITEFQLDSDVVPNIKEFYNFQEEWLYGNYQDVININNELKVAAGIQPDLEMNTSLIYEDGFMLSDISDQSVRFPVFTIEMETGTGKTYVYFRTIHELKKQYGFRKYIVVVPSIAIYEGTIKGFKQTKEHFKTLYGNENIHLTEYDGQQISKVRSFATSSFTEIMVMTIDSFNKSNNIIYKPTEKIQGEWLPIQYIQATRPILILDESQNYRSNLSREALRTLNPLFAVNYSATPVDKFNLIFKLSPVDAFRHNLVKKIKVLGVTQQHNLNDINLSLLIENISNEKGKPTAIVQAYVIENGSKVQKAIQLKDKDDLFIKTHNEDFKGFIVEEIHAGRNTITFTNQSVLTKDGNGGITLSKKEIFRVQIEETIKFHFERQKALRDKGIKVLSLFFIDRVSNYKGDDPVIKNIFEEAFTRLKQNDDYFKKFDAKEVHSGYFAQKKGETIFLDSFDLTGKKDTDRKKILEAEKEAFHLIMQDKERLLSFTEKTSFIFAHSALREGWDNPNVFNICLLKEPNYDTINQKNTRRQELGRGLRLAVNQDGERDKDDFVNILTVICPESFENYVNSLQNEYAETGDAAPQKPSDAKRIPATRNDSIYKSDNFRAFWTNLAKQTDYTINIDSTELIKQCISKLNNVTFPETQIVITKGEFVISNYNFILLEVKVGLSRIRLNITDINGRNDLFEQWYRVGYDFGRRTKDINLSGYKIVQIDEHPTDPVLYFGNNVILLKNQPHSFSGNPNVIQHQRTVQEAQEVYPVCNLIERTSKATGLTRPTIITIFKNLEERKKSKIFINPEGFATVFIKEIKEQLANHIAEKIDYSLTKAIVAYNPDKFFPKEKEFPQRELIPGSKHSLYDQIQTDSDVERNFVQWRLQEDDKNGNVICYFKFPANFKIRIPKIIMNYNPDWGILRLSEDGTHKLQLVRETKGSMNPNLLQFSNEKRKIDCAKKHFRTIGIDYRQVTDKIPNYWESEPYVIPADQTYSIAAEDNPEYKP